MLLAGNLAAFLLLLCLVQTISSGHGTKAGGRKKKPDQSSTTAIRGKFTRKDDSQCTWAASGQERVTLKVTCRPGEAVGSGGSFDCEYVGEPGLCPAHSANPKAYWRQISRALRKQRKLCLAQEPVRAPMCKNAPPSMHFRLSTGSARMVTTPEGAVLIQATPTPECSDSVRSDYQRAAKEKCGESWQSVCTFIFTLLLSKDC